MISSKMLIGFLALCGSVLVCAMERHGADSLANLESAIVCVAVLTDSQVELQLDIGVLPVDAVTSLSW